jgi:hypothetical protein
MRPRRHDSLCECNLQCNLAAINRGILDNFAERAAIHAGSTDRHGWPGSRVKVYLHAPIPSPRLWLASTDAESPPGFMRMLSATIAPGPAKIPATALVPSKDIDGLRSQVQRLLLAFECCDEASRLEVIKIAERLGGIA